MFRSNIKFFLAFFIATMLFAVVQAYAVWQDAPAAPAQYGAVGSGQEQDDYKPVNLGSTVQTKTGGLNIGGNVGIGTTPSFSIGRGLHITGIAGTPDAVIKLSETTSGLGNFELRSVARGTSGNRLEIGEGSDVFLTVRSDDDSGGTTSRGNVGIGTVSPYAKLQIDMQNLATTEGLHISRTSPASYSYLNIEDENSSPIFKVHQSGNVGIGTTTPAYKLGVNGNISATQLCIAGDCKSSWSNTPDLQAVTDIGTSTTNVIGASAFYDSDDPARTYFINPNSVGNAAVLRGNVTVGGALDAVTLREGGVAVQKRVSGFCDAGNSIRAIASNGTVTCEPDDTGASYTAGAGIDIIGTTISNLGVTSVNAKTGAVSIAAGTGININNGSSIVISSAVGSGTTNYVAKWASANTLGNSMIQDNGTNVGVGGVNSAWMFNVEGNGVMGGIRSSSNGGTVGVYGASIGASGVRGISSSGPGVSGSSSSGDGIVGASVSGYAGNFNGRVRVDGNINISSGSDILVSDLYPLTSTAYINSDVNGSQVWTDNVLTINDSRADAGWWAPATAQSLTLTQPALGFRIRGSSDDGGLCAIWVTDMFKANITNQGWTADQDLTSGWNAGGSYTGSGAGGMNSTNNTFMFQSLTSGKHLNKRGLICDIYGNCVVEEVDNCTSNCLMDDQWGYIKPYNLNMIPAGRTMYLWGGRGNGGGPAYINCYLDVLYATQKKPF